MAAPNTRPITVEQFRSGKVIPDVIEDLADPALDMRLNYNETEVANGLRLRVSQTQHAPHVEFRDRDFGDHLYTLLMVDPDAPSPHNPSFRHFLHWSVINIPGSIPPSQKIWDHGKEVLSYMGPAPPEGEHRYVFLVYRQQGTLEDIQRPTARKHFDLKPFTQKYKLGLPVAGVYFVAKHGDELDYPSTHSAKF